MKPTLLVTFVPNVIRDPIVNDVVMDDPNVAVDDPNQYLAAGVCRYCKQLIGEHRVRHFQQKNGELYTEMRCPHCDTLDFTWT